MHQKKRCRKHQTEKDFFLDYLRKNETNIIQFL
jgi:hypothetical protein